MVTSYSTSHPFPSGRGLYGGKIVECSIYNHVVSGQAKDTHRVLQLGHEPGRKASEMMMELSEGRAKKIGSDIPIKSSGLDEECERELENERELEREAERQYARYAPNAPRKWEFKELLKSEHPSEHKALGIMPLHEAMSKSFDPKLQLSSQIEWQHSGIYVTQNFFETVLIKDLGSKLEDYGLSISYGLYMRPVQLIVTFQSSKCCLLSEWEAENVLEILWKRPESKVRIVQMCYLCEAADTKYVKGVRLALPETSSSRFSSISRASGLSSVVQKWLPWDAHAGSPSAAVFTVLCITQLSTCNVLNVVSAF
jgi:hypothetical protein